VAYAQPPVRDRVGAAALSALVAGAVGWMLWTGLAFGYGVGQRQEALETFAVALPRPPEQPVTPPRRRVRRQEGRAAPPGLKSQATQVTAPVPVIPPPVPPPPMVVAPVVGAGNASTQGAAARPGPGPGAGGIGDGRGAGGDGDGDGGGWADETPPRRVRGRLRDSDYPEGAADAGASGVVSVRYWVEVDGRVTGCRVTRSSGSAELDAVTCRLIERRFRYAPSRDAHGRPVRSVVVVDHEWVLDRVPGE